MNSRITVGQIRSAVAEHNKTVPSSQMIRSFSLPPAIPNGASITAAIAHTRTSSATSAEILELISKEILKMSRPHMNSVLF